MEEINIFKVGGGAKFYFFCQKTVFGPLFYYLSECNSSFGLVSKSFYFFALNGLLRVEDPLCVLARFILLFSNNHVIN